MLKQLDLTQGLRMSDFVRDTNTVSGYRDPLHVGRMLPEPSRATGFLQKSPVQAHPPVTNRQSFHRVVTGAMLIENSLT